MLILGHSYCQQYYFLELTKYSASQPCKPYILFIWEFTLNVIAYWVTFRLLYFLVRYRKSIPVLDPIAHVRLRPRQRTNLVLRKAEIMPCNRKCTFLHSIKKQSQIQTLSSPTSFLLPPFVIIYGRATSRRQVGGGSPRLCCTPLNGVKVQEQDVAVSDWSVRCWWLHIRPTWPPTKQPRFRS